jgi:hypothetical protein
MYEELALHDGNVVAVIDTGHGTTYKRLSQRDAQAAVSELLNPAPSSKLAYPVTIHSCRVVTETPDDYLVTILDDDGAVGHERVVSKTAVASTHFEGWSDGTVITVPLVAADPDGTSWLVVDPHGLIPE